MKHIIVAPHPDDELIGCFEIISNKDNACVIIYTDDVEDERKEEALKLKEKFNNVKAQFFQNSIPTHLIAPTNRYYFTDPIHEVHHDHRASGTMGEHYARQGLDVIFYSVNMQAPYCHKVKLAGKEDILNEVYSSQSDLWKYEKKYVLFEGRCKWLFNE